MLADHRACRAAARVSGNQTREDQLERPVQSSGKSESNQNRSNQNLHLNTQHHAVFKFFNASLGSMMDPSRAWEHDAKDCPQIAHMKPAQTANEMPAK